MIEENTLERKMLYITFSIMCACMVQEGQLNFRQEICTLQWKKKDIYISLGCLKAPVIMEIVDVAFYHTFMRMTGSDCATISWILSNGESSKRVD